MIYTIQKIADLDGDGDLDILGKPYDGDAPRLDIWLQNGTDIKKMRSGNYSFYERVYYYFSAKNVVAELAGAT